MQRNKLLQKDYTLSSLYHQMKLPLDVEILIPADDPVRLLSAFVEEMELSDLYKTYGKIKKHQATPRQLFKIIVYASMSRIYSSRDIETACPRDINFMYLLEGKPVPDHATIARFISLHFVQCREKTLAEVSKFLYSLGEISGKTIFIDGTKIESAANKYTFVWKKAVTKNQAKLFDKVLILVEECETLYGLKIVHNGKVSLHTLKRLRKKLYRIRKEKGIVFVHGTGRRKTRLQKSIETLETYITKLKDMEKYLPFQYREIVADAGYESEENYLFLEENGQMAYIKPQNYEISKTRTYRQDIGKMENMAYDEETDCYYCQNGQALTPEYEKKEKTASGYRRTVTVYRSIQAEGSFANIKEDMEFRRYLYRGKANVTAQGILVAIGYNIKKLHHKIQAGRTARHLFPLKESA